MKVQTSIEFLLILSVVSILSLSLVSAYKNNMSGAKYILNSTIQSSNSINSYSSAYAPLQHPGIFVSVPINSTANKQNMMQVVFYGCINGTGSIRLGSNYIIFSQNSIENLTIENIAISSLEFEPLFAGPDLIYVNYSIACGQKNVTGSSTFTTYSTVSPGGSLAPNGGTQLYAYISKRNESLFYPISMQSGIENIGGPNHCTTVNFWGNPYPIWIECGTTNAWVYRTESDSCYWDGPSGTESHCVVPSGSGQNTYSTNPSNPSYNYHFQLSVASEYGLLNSTVSDYPRSVLFDGNQIVGNVTVVNVSGVSDYQAYDFVGNSSNMRIANQTLYHQYLQAMNNMYSILSYYNNTEVSSSTASAIQQAISEYTTAGSELMNSAGSAPQQCSIIAGNYTCKSAYPFSYVINVRTSLNLQNQTLYYAGSVISVTGKQGAG